MPTLHIANTQFEWELKNRSDLKNSFSAHPLHTQLQFLPFLYAPPEDSVLLFHQPVGDYFDHLHQIRPHLPKAVYYDTLNLENIDTIESWGASAAIENWAKKNQLIYSTPAISIVKMVTAKSFAFENTPKLKKGAALHNKSALFTWLEEDFWPKVIKTNYDTAGRGNRILPCKTALHDEEILTFCQREWTRGQPVIGEPWVKRTIDFSTQWQIDNSIKFLGSTLMECSERGSYLKSTITKEVAFDLAAHKQMAMPLLEKILKLGYFGPIGIDGFTFSGGQHITEVNARKTMGWVALQLSQILHCDLSIEMTSPNDAQCPLLPFQVQGLKPFKLQLDLMKSALLN
ncbi:MAG: hypothetical protein KDK44_06390 [Chlamydiia bacterium]|nr:hypothetical protein [Chlamydiia bacterium]